MSLFRKPKKLIQRRVFSGYDDDDQAPHLQQQDETSNGSGGPMEVDQMAPPPPCLKGSASSRKEKKSSSSKSDVGSSSSTKKSSSSSSAGAASKMSLLSFDDEGNTFCGWPEARIEFACWLMFPFQRLVGDNNYLLNIYVNYFERNFRDYQNNIAKCRHYLIVVF